MSRSTVRSLLASALAAGLTFGAASPALAYVVVLKGGKRHIAIDKPVERDGHMTFVEKGSRAQYTVALADVDLEQTKEANAAGAGDAYLLGTPDGSTKLLKPPGSSKSSLNDRVQRAKKTPRAVARTTSADASSESTAADGAEGKTVVKRKKSKAPTPTPTPPLDR